MQVTSLVRATSGFERAAQPDFEKRLGAGGSDRRSFGNFLDEKQHVETYDSLTLAMEDFLALVELPTIPNISNRKQEKPTDATISPYGFPAHNDGSYLMKFDA